MKHVTVYAAAAIPAIAILAHAAEPICHTLFHGFDPNNAASLTNSANWTNGLPGNGRPGCMYDEVSGEVHFVGLADSSNEVGANRVGPTGACCMGTSCVLLEADDCFEKGGFPAENVTACFPPLCATGACCLEPDQCRDDNGLGGAMDKPTCDAIGGTYVGSANCVTELPCPFQHLPEGFEFITVSSPELGEQYNSRPATNNCGEVVFHHGANPNDLLSDEIYYYDNGRLQRITKNEYQDAWAKINDDGILIWTESPDALIEWTLQLRRDGQTHSIANGYAGDINGAGHVVGYSEVPKSCTYQTTLQYYDGEGLFTLFDDGLSNQSPCINESDEIVWTNYTFPCDGECCGGWTSNILHYANGSITTYEGMTAQVPEIDNLGRVAAQQGDQVLVWQDGVHTQTLIGNNPSLNDLGDIAFNSNNYGATVWEVRLQRNGRLHRLSPAEDLQNWKHNHSPNMNDWGEVVWVQLPNGEFSPSEIRMLRKIRTGDVDLDLDVDREDFAKFPLCYTGPGDFDRLCECRFLDIDHDRDVDDNDYALFLANYTGPMDDCDGNSSLDLDDILYGPALDCNRNGIPDSCDINGGGSPDLGDDGIPDDCVYDTPKPIWREIFPFWTNRFLTLVPRKEWGSVALKVTLTSLHHVDPPYTGGASVPFTAFEGQTRWIGPPTQYQESSSSAVPFWSAKLQCTPHYQLWTGIDLLHVTGSEVVPSSEYHVAVQSIGCQGREMDCPWESSAVRIKTARWGDVAEPLSPPSTTVQPDITDLSALVNKFRSAPDAPIKARALLAGAPGNVFGEITPDVLSVDFGFSHISACVDAFRGVPYPYTIETCP